RPLCTQRSVSCAWVVPFLVLVGVMLQPAGVVAQAAPDDGADPASDPLPKHAVARLGSLRWRAPSAVHLGRVLDGGKTLLTIDVLGQARWWDTATGKTLASAARKGPPGKAAIYNAVLSPDHKLLAGMDAADLIHVVDVKTGRVVRSFNQTTPLVYPALA